MPQEIDQTCNRTFAMDKLEHITPGDETIYDLMRHVNCLVSLGCFYRPESLGIIEMPPGYALMMDSDLTYWFWIRYDGI